MNPNLAGASAKARPGPTQEQFIRLTSEVQQHQEHIQQMWQSDLYMDQDLHIFKANQEQKELVHAEHLASHSESYAQLKQVQMEMNEQQGKFITELIRQNNVQEKSYLETEECLAHLELEVQSQHIELAAQHSELAAQHSELAAQSLEMKELSVKNRELQEQGQAVSQFEAKVLTELAELSARSNTIEAEAHSANVVSGQTSLSLRTLTKQVTTLRQQPQQQATKQQEQQATQQQSQRKRQNQPCQQQPPLNLHPASHLTDPSQHQQGFQGMRQASPHPPQLHPQSQFQPPHPGACGFGPSPAQQHQQQQCSGFSPLPFQHHQNQQCAGQVSFQPQVHFTTNEQAQPSQPSQSSRAQHISDSRVTSRGIYEAERMRQMEQNLSRLMLNSFF